MIAIRPNLLILSKDKHSSWESSSIQDLPIEPGSEGLGAATGCTTFCFGLNALPPQITCQALRSADQIVSLTPGIGVHAGGA